MLPLVINSGMTGIVEQMIYINVLLLPLWSTGLIYQFLDHLQAVGLLDE
jgi:hypothetical protein